VSSRQESGTSGRRNACPSDFPAEVTDIPEAMQAAAAGIAAGIELPIELDGDDPAFMLAGEVLGWLAVNIDEVSACLRAGWRYHGTVLHNQPSPAGPVIMAQVFAAAPTS